jgi:acyl carrier protein
LTGGHQAFLALGYCAGVEPWDRIRLCFATMKAAVDLAASVLDLLRARSPLAGGDAGLADDLPLGAGGLGLDSIALAELLLECEARFGLATTAELLAGPPLTVGLLVAHVRGVVGR